MCPNQDQPSSEHLLGQAKAGAGTFWVIWTLQEPIALRSFLSDPAAVCTLNPVATGKWTYFQYLCIVLADLDSITVSSQLNNLPSTLAPSFQMAVFTPLVYRAVQGDCRLA